jgi:integrase
MEKEMKNKMIGHNEPPKTLDDFLIYDQNGKSTGRIKLNNTIIKKYLVKKYDKEKDEYKTVIVSDSEKIGLKVKKNIGAAGAVSFFYKHQPKGKNIKGKRLNSVFYHLGYFPEMSVDAARSLVEDLKLAIKLGQDPRSIIEERRKAKTLIQAIDHWKKDVLHKAARFSESSIKNTEQGLKNWIYLEAIYPRTNRIILNNKSDLDIGNKRMVEITKGDLIAWHAAVTKSGDYIANRVMDDLNVIFKWAKENKYIKENICKFKENELNPEYKRLEDVDPYSVEELRKLRKAAIKLIKKCPRVALACYAVLLIMYTGRRYKSEILKLRWGQVDWDANKVRLKETKTGKSQFSINRLSRWVLRKLYQHKKINFTGKKIKSIKAQYLFPATRKSKKPYIQDIRKTWNKICDLAGVRIEEPYLLRHSWACMALEATNGNIAVVKEEGGWKTYEMVEIYAKYNRRKLQKQSEVIGNYLAHARR